MTHSIVLISNGAKLIILFVNKEKICEKDVLLEGVYVFMLTFATWKQQKKTKW